VAVHGVFPGCGLESGVRMSAPTTAENLFQLIRKSGLIDEGRLVTFAQAHQHDGLLQQEPKRLASALVREGVLTYFHAEQFLLGKWRGFNLGKYRLLERIGVGGMGQVFLCEHVFMRKRVAIKVLPPTKAEDPVSLGRFYREARVASSLDHPNVVRTYDIDQDGPLHFLVMEYVDGISLLDLVKKTGPMNILRACHYMKQAAKGLDYAHQSGMIHRDIKPGNIMIDRAGNAKILDMGLARFYRDEKDQLTLKYDDKNVLGTADYVSPEQTRDSRNIDTRADIYGLGATFQFMLTGQPPFPDGTVAEKLISHQTKKPRTVREIRPEVSQGLSKIIEKMLAKDPADRFQSASEVAAALEVSTEASIEPPPPEEMPKLSPAALAESAFAKKQPTMGSAVRETPHSRAADTDLGRTPGVPMPRIHPITAGSIETAATIPLPPKKPADTGLSPSAKGDTGSVVDVLAPVPPKPLVNLKSSADLEISETRPMPADPTPQTDAAPVASVPEKPKTRLDLKIPGLDLSRLKKSAGITEPAAERPDASTKPLVNVSKPSTTLPGSRELPKPPAVLGGSRELPKPPTALGGSRDLPKLPLPGSKEAVLPGSRLGASSLPGSKDTPKPASPSREQLKPTPLSPSDNKPRIPGTSNWPSNQPTYRPPELMPFMTSSTGARKKPGIAATIIRWIVMMTLSSLAGAGLGTAIWYLFLR